MIRFLLGKAPALKELVISMSKRSTVKVHEEVVTLDARKRDQYKKTIEEIPRASNSSSIIFASDDEVTPGCVWIFD